MNDNPLDREPAPVAANADNPQTPRTATKPRRHGTPLSTGLLAVAVCAVLMMLAKPLPPSPLDSGRPAVHESAIVVAIVVGGILAVILALYAAGSWKTAVASYFVGVGTTAIAMRLLVEPQDTRLAFLGASLLLLFSIVVRLAQRKTVVG